MDTSHCKLFSDIPRSLGMVQVLVQLVDIIDNHKLCEGCEGTENYQWLNNDLILYKTRDGKNAVFIENEKLRSTSCQLLACKKVITI